MTSEKAYGWYPNVPMEPMEGVLQNATITDKKVIPRQTIESINWDPALKYAPTLWWASDIKKEKKEACRRHFIKGIEVRDLGKDHFLCGERGVFATERFERFDIVGEYTGRVVDDSINGHYVAALEDKTLNESLGINAEHCGNEMRYINSYLNIDFEANVSMRTVYMNTYPHIVIVCTKDIEVGDELLLDYGKAYNDYFLTPKLKVDSETISMTTLRKLLPGCESDSDNNESDTDK